MRSKFITIVIIAIFTTVYVAKAEQNSANAPITLGFKPTVNIAFNTGSFDLLISGGATSASATLGYTANGNVPATVSIAVTRVPHKAPGTWSATVNNTSLIPNQPLTGIATVTVSNVPNTSAAQIFTGGVCTITITSNP
jgi:hypothetical protein